MPRLLMVGLSHHAAPLEVRERVVVDEAAWRRHAPAGFSTLLLSTCNRVEVYAWIEGRTQRAARTMMRCLARAADVPLVEIEPYLTTRSSRDALLHLVRVASGLDSLLVGEEQIRGQVRAALRAGEEAEDLSATLRGVFQRAIESARRIRGSTRLAQAPSIAAAGVNVARRATPRGVQGQLAVVLGAGVMARAAAEALLASGARVRLLNRTPAHADRMLATLRSAIDVGSLDGLPAALTEAVLVVGATAARSTVVNLADIQAALKARTEPLVILDIAVPRDVDPRVRELQAVTLIDLDDLERLCPVDTPTRHAEQERAEALAAEEADRLGEWLRFRAVSPAIAELRTYAEGIRTAELRRSASRLRDLTPEQLQAVDALTSGIVKKLMHGPTIALRDAALRQASPGRSRSQILRVLRPAGGPRGRTA
ncbi:MAG: glutamyl-tRNA reductase [Chloroflexi bacterium]|nr:glutamyl-tRNA reductase [Chloroflexota bacterium]